MSRKREIAQLGEEALETLRGPVLTEVRRRFASWRDPRAKLLRQRKRAKRTATGGAATAGVFGAGAVGTGVGQATLAAGSGLEEVVWGLSSFGMGGVAAAGAAVAVGFGVKYRRLKRTPLPPERPDPVALPAAGSAARPSMQRLRDAEESLHAALSELGAIGAGAAAADARATADHTAAELRRGAQRLVAVESAIRHAPESQKGALREDVERLRGELDEGVDGYGGLVAAAGQALAASGSVEQTHLLQDATDKLAGLADGMREVFGDPDSPELRG
ncbi:phage shock envelope stress response protein PspM [Saccharopolyspora griseoalba]|uniref:Uncharacterized protein n=1 Tax=Saccharopolyspora griseoalba TaxID=1431848 RepID=A0ABW2LDU4_9PSEU